MDKDSEHFLTMLSVVSGKHINAVISEYLEKSDMSKILMDQSAFISVADDFAGLLHQQWKLILTLRVMLAECTA